MSTISQSPAITPFLWFENNNAEEAVDLYVSIFPNSRKIDEFRNPSDVTGPKGSVLTISFELNGLRFTALNGGPGHPFTDAVSFVVQCADQQEIDHYWSKLLEGGGSPIACGWLKDKYGLRWQIWAPRILELIRHPKAMQAMMGMTKFDLAELERAAASD
jgi:predicted 3-demethylubiquinone-9 3-methyltransferase (glyoxalase superfamily)